MPVMFSPSCAEASACVPEIDRDQLQLPSFVHRTSHYVQLTELFAPQQCALFAGFSCKMAVLLGCSSLSLPHSPAKA